MRILLLFTISLFFLVGCTETEVIRVVVDEDGNVIEELPNKEKVTLQVIGEVEVLREDGSLRTSGSIYQDLKTGCKSITFGHSNLNSLLDENGNVQGCKNIGLVE